MPPGASASPEPTGASIFVVPFRADALIPLALVAGIAVVVLWPASKARSGGTGPSAVRTALLRLTRISSALAVGSGIALLVFDSPAPIHYPAWLTRPVVEATPLLVVGTAFLAWLAANRPAAIEWVKQGFVALAFILWGIDLLMPAGRWATFVGAVVIAIYVFDLAWLMEASLRKGSGASPPPSPVECEPTDCRSAGVCWCGAACRPLTGVPHAATMADRQPIVDG